LIGTDAERSQAAADAVFRAASGIWSVSATGDPWSADDSHRMLTELSSALGDPDIVVDCLARTGDPSAACGLAHENMLADDDAESASYTIVLVGVAPPPNASTVAVHSVASDGSWDDVAARVVKLLLSL
jgi:hypothetical protein